MIFVAGQNNAVNIHIPYQDAFFCPRKTAYLMLQFYARGTYEAVVH